MTEEEAKQRWCPFATALYLDVSSRAVSMNRMGDGQVSSAAHCVGSACMAWRKTIGKEGRCGLAGQP